jgi:hypothetical protein
MRSIPPVAGLKAFKSGYAWTGYICVELMYFHANLYITDGPGYAGEVFVNFGVSWPIARPTKPAILPSRSWTHSAKRFVGLLIALALSRDVAAQPAELRVLQQRRFGGPTARKR